jgi:hypothetical protein
LSLSWDEVGEKSTPLGASAAKTDPGLMGAQVDDVRQIRVSLVGRKSTAPLVNHRFNYNVHPVSNIMRVTHADCHKTRPLRRSILRERLEWYDVQCNKHVKCLALCVIKAALHVEWWKMYDRYEHLWPEENGKFSPATALRRRRRRLAQLANLSTDN